MPSLLNPGFWLAIIIGLALTFCAGDFNGSHRERKKIELRDAQAEAAALSKVRDESRNNVIAIDNIAAANQKEKEHAQAKINQLRADVRRGAVRLSVATSPSTASRNTGATNPETRSELLPEVSESILDIGTDADNTVRDLNSCVDSYNAIRGR